MLFKYLKGYGLLFFPSALLLFITDEIIDGGLHAQIYFNKSDVLKT